MTVVAWHSLSMPTTEEFDLTPEKVLAAVNALLDEPSVYRISEHGVTAINVSDYLASNGFRRTTWELCGDVLIGLVSDGHLHATRKRGGKIFYFRRVGS